jgi:anti-anti-sigma factor
MEGLTQKTRTLQASIVSGSVVLLSGSGLTTAINLSYNIVLARFLGPQGFGHATAVYTILTLISAVTLSFQIISAKVVAKQSTPEGKAAVYRGFHRSAWGCGILVALILVFFQGAIADYLNLPSPTLIALLAMGAAFYVPLGCRRGYIQGTYGFRRLATNLVVEGVVRLGGSLLMILLGFGVAGVIAANSAAVAVAYLAAAPTLAARIPNPIGLSFALREAAQAMVFFSGQVLINNCDIVLVKHFFSPKEAGLYAAVAMVGRVIFSFSSAVVNSMFPLVAGTRDEERKDLKVIAISLSLVLFTGSVLALGLIVAPARIWTTFFGAGFEIAGKYDLPYLLALYAVTTIVYSLSVVIITFEMSYKIANTSWVQLAFSGVLIACLCRFHSSLREVILVQLVLMTALLISVALPFLIKSLSKSKELSQAGSGRSVRLIRHVSENEVIAEFLKSDFGSPEFREYQESLRAVVGNPDLDDADENAKRRALLFIRHRALWKELPTGTEWYEVEIADADLGQIRVFPRAQWRKLARGNYSITEVAECMRTGQHLVDAPFLSKIASIGDQLHQEDPGFSAVILIGLNERGPLTVLDGNHRLAAAMLASPSRLDKLRFLCGLSPRMKECCWYNTNLITLFRYGRNMLVRALHNSEAELPHLLQDPEKPRTSMQLRISSRLSFAENQSKVALGDGSKRRLRENQSMTSREVAAMVKELPETLSVKLGRRFLSELKITMSEDRPCIVLDCSNVRIMDRSIIHVLLCCLEEAIKHNGDVRLAAVREGARSTLEITGVGRLFEIFETNADAVNSFRLLSADGALHVSVPDSSHEAA